MGILKHVSTEKPLMIVVDTSVMIHKMHQSFPMHHSDPAFNSAIQANLVWLMSGEWLGDYKDNLKSIVFVTDVKKDMGYWRTEWLRDINNVIDIPRKTKALQKLTEDTKRVLATPYMERTEEDDETLKKAQEKLTIHYKAGRKLPEYSFTKLKKLTYKYLDEMGANVLGSVGFEADDLAASLVVTNRDAGSPWDILLLTVDTDWLQLVDHSVTWLCMTGYSPPVRDTLEVVNTWAQKRLKTTLTHWHDIVAVKGDKGDASDNLPPSNGVLIPVIDLINPPVHYRYWLRAPEKLKALFVEQTPRFDQTAAHASVLYLRKVGSKPTINYVPGESPAEKAEAEYELFNQLEPAGAF